MRHIFWKNRGMNGSQISERDLIDEKNTKTIPVIEEFLNVGKKVVETGKVHVHKKIEKEKATIDIPLKGEEFEVKRVSVKTELLDHRPSSFEKDGMMIIPVVREVAQVIIKYEVTEEIHIIKHLTQTNHHEEVTLLKEKAEIQREDSAQTKKE